MVSHYLFLRYRPSKSIVIIIPTSEHKIRVKIDNKLIKISKYILTRVRIVVDSEKKRSNLSAPLDNNKIIIDLRVLNDRRR